MPIFEPNFLETLCFKIFMSCGTPEEDAALVARELVMANLMGMDSHGVIRIMQYVNYIVEGHIVPGAAITIVRETPTTAIVDCGKNFGQVGAVKSLEVAIRKARSNYTSCVITHQCNHVGRLGAYAQMAAEQDMICLLVANGDTGGHFVAPWGGIKGRLATNPIAFAAPRKVDPLLVDISTSVLSEGKIRDLLYKKRTLPDNAVLDAEGKATVDPAVFYGPPKGAILPLGGDFGYKGFALSIMVAILGGTLAGSAIDDETVFGNGLCFIIIDPTAFIPLEDFKHLMEALYKYVKSTPLAEGFNEVLLPGERDFKKIENIKETGVFLDDAVWNQISEIANRYAVRV
jgi:uncharacterized oxidoreductase